MSDRGVFALVVRRGEAPKTCIIIGKMIPRIHHSDGVPIYLVVEGPDGADDWQAYPSHWPAPGLNDGKTMIYLDYRDYYRHKRTAPVPCFVEVSHV